MERARRPAQSPPLREPAPRRRIRGSLLLPMAILFLVGFCALVGPFIMPYSPTETNPSNRLQPPGISGSGAEHLLGTDSVGRDILSRIILGARISLVVTLAGVAFAGFVGTILGVVSGYFGGSVDTVIMRATDAFLSIPYIFLAILIVSLFGTGLVNVVLVIALVYWAQYSRMARAEVLSLKEREFVVAARVIGCSSVRIMGVHIFPNVANTIIVLATLQVGTAILFEAALSFLGMGVPPPNPSWGSMVAGGRDFIASAWWLSFFPGLAIVLTVLSANLLGDWLRDTLDPKRRRL